MIERAFVRLSEGQMHLRRRDGQGEGGAGRPLLLFHASPASSWVMQGLMTALGEAGFHRTIVAPDTLGNGDSPPPAPDAPDIAYFAESKLRMIDALGIDQVDLYGSHSGARIACEFAAAYPDRVGKLVLDGITEYDDETRQLVIDKYAPKVEPDEYGRHLIWAFNFVRDQHFYFPYFQRDPAHRLAGHLSDPATLHRITLDVLKALDSCSKPYLAAFAYRAFTRMPAIVGDRSQHIGGHRRSGVGAWLGPLAMLCSVIGPTIGGLLVDRHARRGDDMAKLAILTIAPSCVIPSALAVLAPGFAGAVVLVASSGAIFAVIGTTMFALLQVIVPGDMRGVAVALTGLVNTILGATLGPLLVATITEHLFADPAKVGYSILPVVIPAVLAGSAFFAAARRALRRQNARGGEIILRSSAG